MVLREPSRPSTRSRRSQIYVSPYELAANEWLHPDFEYDEGVVPKAECETEQKPKDFHIFDVPPPLIPPFEFVLPARDPFGWPHGDNYTPLLKARTPLISTRAVMPGFKLERLHQALSMAEFRVLMKLAFHPAVLDFREQYGIYNRRAYWRARAQGKRMRRSDLMTIDVIVTFVQPPGFELKYHAISIKHAGYRPTERHIRRENRERKAMAERGWTWELLRGDAISMTEFGNLRLLYINASQQNLPSLYFAAQEFAPVVLASSNRGTFDAVMLRVARSMKIGHDDAYHRFSAAVAYGFLEVDHNYELDTHLTLKLVRNRRGARSDAQRIQL